MQVAELLRLVPWYSSGGGAEANRKLQALQQAVQYHVQGSQRVPLIPLIEDYEQQIDKLSYNALSDAQKKLLEEAGVLIYFSPGGKKIIREIVEQSGYDPATAFGELGKAITAFSNFESNLSTLYNGLNAFGMASADDVEDSDKVIVRIHFSGRAGINNIADFKLWGSDWYDIVRGITKCIGCAPEDFEIVGASTGSVTIIAGVSLAIAKFLAILAKQVNIIVKEIYEIRNTIEDFKHKTYVNAELRNAFKSTLDEHENKGPDLILEAMKKAYPGIITGEAENWLKSSIQKFISFSDKGGEVELLPPSVAEEDAPEAEAIKEVTQIVKEVRKLRDEVQQLMLPGIVKE